MRDFRNAKAMAKTLREALAERSFQISHSESLELIARALGNKNWQTLSAAIEASAGQAAARPIDTALPACGLLPVVPMRDLVLFPEMTVPVFAGRPKTLKAIEQALAGDRRVFVVTQRRSGEASPGGADDLHEVGVVAQVLQTQRLPDGSMKVTVQAERRARLVRLLEGDLQEAEVEPIETPMPDEAGQALARQTLERFSGLANFDPAAPPMAMARIAYMTAHPGMFADLIAPQVATGLDQAQELLATADPAARLEKLMTLMREGRRAA